MNSLRLAGLVGGASAALMASTALTPQSAAAQETGPAQAERSSVAANTIIVTARRRDENLQEVPISITVIDNATLDDLRIENIEDLEVLEPTLSVSAASGRPNRPVYSLRGIRPTEAIYGQDPTVAVYFADTVQSPAQGSNLAMYDLQNVQILKGPQGTLFGRNTVGGAILLTPRAPGDDFAANVMAGIGNFGLFEAEAGIDIPLGDSVAVRVSGRTVHSDGYQVNVAPGPLQGDRYGGEDTWQGRVTAQWNPAPGIENTTIFTYDDQNTTGVAQVIQAANPNGAFIQCYDGPGNPVGGTSGLCAIEAAKGLVLPSIFDAVERANGRDVTEVETNVDLFADVEAWGLINTTTAELNDELTFKSILSYREVESISNGDLDATAIPGILDLFDQVSTLDHYSVELQLQGDSLGGRLDWVGGFYYYHEDGSEIGPGTFFSDLLAFSPLRQGGTVDNDTYALFAQASFELTPELSITAGGRMNWDEKSVVLLSRSATGCSLSVGSPPQPLPLDQCEVPLSESFSQPTGSVAIDYQITPDVLLYATGRLGYRAGGFNLRADVLVEYEPFQQETVWDIEGGTKADWYIGGVAMRSNIAVYYQWYDDIQRTVAVENIGGSPGSAVVNAASATVFGIELQQQIRPTDDLTLQFGYSYVDPQYEDWIEEFTGTDLSETPFFFTPTHSGNATLIYERPLADDWGDLKFLANASYTGDQWINALHTIAIINQQPDELLPLLRQESYWLVNASLGIDDIGGSGIDVQAYVRNLTDEDYKVGGVQLYNGATGNIAATFGTPRTYGLQARISF
ncbi:TonB-dependent receptor [Croceicoccus hydrothermalis]|uniref:TonB-dependent receptor n=1 Tax=Croceicoccus hydrothermalis TaxID=2867964 RepID=UPI001EFB53F7|nr:TonB-dependent receptor [Croceicoccus hydrothermalis]